MNPIADEPVANFTQFAVLGTIVDSDER